ncbi:MAG: asparagine synthase (glutamine-hydrolyzing) [Planctomycetota bacterium]|nr:MAG: asparagine synthase (glutamine-hydrolyzing) [Planctomycetota bacterium]
MCGIAGYIGLQPRDPRQTLINFNEAIKHRGPDASGFWHKDNIGLSHTRLSIIDLSDAGTQPMHSKHNLHLVFNGEIYNFNSLKKDLTNQEFKSHSDSEVLLNYIDQFGIDKTLDAIEGMYAFALYDGNDQSLYLVRDRMGQKPLYYWHEKGQLVFGSELSVIKSYLGKNIPLDQNGIALYWKYGYIPTPHTAYKNIFKLPQATVLHWKQKKISSKTYWSIPPVSENSQIDNILDELNNRIQKSVQQRLISDAPLGVFLSGGLDSAIITSYAKESIEDLKTFSMGMNDKSFDESADAQNSAEQFNTNHISKNISYEFENDLKNIVQHFGEPYGDPSSLPTYHLSRITSEYMKVALSGDGADELFGGYYRYLIRDKMDAFSKIPGWIRNPFVNLLASIKKEPPGFYGNSFIKKLVLFNNRTDLLSKSKYNIAPIVFSHEEVKQFSPDQEEITEDPIVQYADRYQQLRAPHQMMWVDTMMYLESDINIKVDRMSMAHGLEVRSPFLDHRICELAAQLTYQEKLNGNNQKYILKQAVKNRIPQNIINRPKKGFGLPLGLWFQTNLKQYFEKNILNDSNGPFDIAPLKKLWAEHQSNKKDHGLKFWQFCIYKEWTKSL